MPRKKYALAWMLGIPVAAFFVGNLLLYPHGRDQEIYAVVARAMLEARPPYLAAWDFKPPGIYFIYAVAQAVVGPTGWGIRALETLGLASVIYAFVLLSKRCVGSSRAGWAAGLVAVAGHVELGFWNTAQPESFGGMLLAWALVCATFDPRPGGGGQGERRRFLAWMGAAVLYSLAGLLKPPLGGGILISLAFVLAARRGRQAGQGPARRYAVPIAAFLLGGSIPPILGLLYFRATGALDALYDALFVFAPRYTSLQLDLARLPGLLWTTVKTFLFGLSPYNTIGLVALLLLPSLHHRERTATGHVLGVTAVTLLGVTLQAKFFPYHFGAAVLLTSLVAGWGIGKTLGRPGLRIAAVSLTTVVLGLMWTGRLPAFQQGAEFWFGAVERVKSRLQPRRRYEIEDRLYSTLDFRFQANRRAAEWIAAHTDERDAIYVWGFEPGIYRLAQRRSPTRFIYNVPQRAPWSREAARAELMRDLARTPPAVIVVESGDVLPWVTGTATDSRRELIDYPELSQWILGRYRPANRIENLEIFVRREP